MFIEVKKNRIIRRREKIKIQNIKMRRELYEAESLTISGPSPIKLKKIY
jgi:hypothetical protein